MNLKKPEFWDYKKPNFISYILWPLSILIKIIIFLKPKKKIITKKIKTICVGNIYIGGTGKTSLAIKINNILLKKNIKSCFVKKYYKNQTDEQNILASNGKLFCEKKRIKALNQAINENYQIAIFDDGLQDYSINYDINLICFNSNNWIGNGMTIPSGPLRENINNLKNYDHIFLNGNLENIDYLKREIIKFNSKINIHLATYEPINLNEFKKNEKYLIFSGIGNHQTFVSMVKKNGLKVLKDIEYPDHYSYTKEDINKILIEASKLNCKIITTEKDSHRITNFYENRIKIIKTELKMVDENKLLKFII